MIDISDLTVTYGKKVAVQGFNLRINDGEHIILMGPNGSGKTTVLKAILGLVPHRGEIRIDGREVSSLSRRELARKVAYVPQIFSTLYTFSVREFISMGLYSVTKDWSSDDERVAEAMRRVRLWELRDRNISNISGGELQKAVIARALVQDSKYIMMDEPTAHLDIKSTKEVLEIVDSLDEKGVVIVSHDISALNKIKGTLVLMKEGKLKYVGYKGDSSLTEKMEEVFELSVEDVNGTLLFQLS
ncbi:MAG: ABC transporter ATP-binding protein [Thermoplasmatales archaeon]